MLPRRLLPIGLVLSACLGLSVQAQDDSLRLFGTTNSTTTQLVDRAGALLHTWPSTFHPGIAAKMDADGNLVRAIVTTAIPGLAGLGGGVQRVALDGTLLWDYRHQRPGELPHHDIEPLPNGNVLMIVYDERTDLDAIQNGRDPGLLLDPIFRSEKIVEVMPTGPTSGTVVWEWSVWDHLIQDHDPSKLNFGAVANHPELIDLNVPPALPRNGDWIHANGLDYDPEHDRIVLSAPHFHEIWVIDHGTTTAEAASHSGGRWGKGGDLLYRWGNPQSYRAGSVQHKLLDFQHAPRFIPSAHPGGGNLLVFDNDRGGAGSEVHELTLPLDANGNFVLGANARYGPAAPTWSVGGFNSRIMSSAERLPSGNTLIASAQENLVFEVEPSGQRVWQTSTSGLVFNAVAVNRFLWQDTNEVSVATGGVITLDLIAGSPYAGQLYLVLGSATGTSPGITGNGWTLPLNPDTYLLTTASLANIGPYANTAGSLDGLGRASATLTIPGGVLPPETAGLRLDHSFLVLDPTTGRITKTGNAVPLVFR